MMNPTLCATIILYLRRPSERVHPGGHSCTPSILLSTYFATIVYFDKQIIDYYDFGTRSNLDRQT